MTPATKDGALKELQDFIELVKDDKIVSFNITYVEAETRRAVGGIRIAEIHDALTLIGAMNLDLHIATRDFNRATLVQNNEI